MTKPLIVRFIIGTWLGMEAFSLSAQRTLHVSVTDGLCTNALTDLTEDRQGNMWIGSYGGLMKYSGTSIRCLDKVGMGRFDLSGPEMHSVTEDQCGYIWVGTTAGLNRIHPVTYEVTQYPVRSPFPGQTSVGYIYSVFADKQDFIWFGTDVAVFRFDTHTGTYAAIPVTGDATGMPGIHVSYNGFHEAGEGLWMLTNAGVTFFEYSTRRFHHHGHNPSGRSLLAMVPRSRDGHGDLKADRQGRLWFVWDHRYLAMYDPAADRLDTVRLALPPGTWMCCYSIGIDARDNVWIGTRHGGLHVYDVTRRRFHSLTSRGINRMIHSEYIYAIERGRSGAMFVAHDQGLDIVDLYDTAIRDRQISGRDDFTNLRYEAYDVAYDPADKKAVMPFTGFGYFTYDPLRDSIAMHRRPVEETGRQMMARAQDGKLFLGSGSNIREVIGVEDTYQLTGQPILPDTVSALRGGVVWYHTTGPGEYWVKKSSGKLLHICPDRVQAFQTAGFKPNICLTADSLGLWYIDPGYELVRIVFGKGSADTIRLQEKLKGLQFSFANPRHILDDGSSVWMTGQNGVLRYRYGPDSLVAYTINEGLAHSFTFALVQDARGQVWVSSLGGIDVYDPDADRFDHVYRMSGLNYMDAFGSVTSSPDGMLFFLFGNRIVTVDPVEARHPRPSPGTIQLQEVQVNARTVDWRDPEALLHLAYNENRLTFRFDLPLFNDLRRYTFRYRINNGDWIDQADRNEIVLHGLSSGRYVLDIQGLASANGPPTDVLAVPFRIRPPFWGTWWFIGGSILAGFLATSLYYRRRLDKVRRENELARQIAELESKALRAQMNPHFVFNALNAIQECIVTKRIDEAYDYLSRFSKLLRAVLEQSDRSDVSLQEELEVLSLYVSLEKLRFKDDMTIVFEVDEALDTGFVRIPPMLIQPHLENAIWHGLRHRPGAKRLELLIRERTEGYLDIVVRDNGVGRARAAALRAQQLGSATHRSKGSALSGDRLALLQTIYPLTAIQVIDLADETGLPLGTAVELRIPMLPHTPQTQT